MSSKRISLIAAVTIAASGCGGDRQETSRVSPAPIAAATATVRITDAPSRTEVTGTVDPWARVSPGTKIMGRIAEVLVREGDHVLRGQVLARLENRDLEAVVAQARAGVAMSEAELERAAAQQRRMVELHGRGSVTDKTLEDAEAAFRIAKAAVQKAAADLEAAEVTLEYSVIRSPVTGWVSTKRVEPGDIASPGMPMFRVDDLSRVKVTVSVAESDVAGLGRGDAVRIRVDAVGFVGDGTVDRILPAGDPRSRTFEVQAVLDNEDERLRPGMFARVSFAGEARDAVSVPGTAIVSRGQLRGVFVVDDKRLARLRWVRLGAREGEQVEVLAGLEAGDRYVVDPPPGLADGVPVEGS